MRGVANWQARAGQGYDLLHFTIDWNRERVTCPQGKVSVSWRPARNTDGSPRIHAQFSRSDCGACAPRPRGHAATSTSIRARSTRRSPRRGRGCPIPPGSSATRSGPGWGHALTGRPRLRNAPEPLHRAGEDRASADLYRHRDERIADRQLDRWPATRQDARHALRFPGTGRLNSPTVSPIRRDASARISALVEAAGGAGNGRPQFEFPAPDRLIRYLEPALRQQFLDVLVASGIPSFFALVFQHVSGYPTIRL